MSKSKAKLSSEVATELDLSLLRYSRVLEDHRVLSEALDIVPEEDIVLSVASAGDNVLNLLLERPKKIIAFDMSPAQTSLLELKLTAIRHLNYHDYLVLLGETEDPGDQRVAVLQKIKHSLPANVQEFWTGHTDEIREGLGTSSRLQKYIKERMHNPLSESVGDQVIDRLFSAQSLEEQRLVWQSMPLSTVEAILRSLFQKDHMVQGRSAAQLKYVDKSDASIGDGVWAGFTRVSCEVDIKDNFYHSWFCRGIRGFDPEHHPEFAPPFLRKEGFAALKGLIDRVEVHTSTIELYLSLQGRPQFTKANLSNIFEYMGKADAEELFRRISENLALGGRIAYWILFLPQYPTACSSLQHLSALSKDLHKRDRVFYYTDFCVYEKLFLCH